MQFMSKIATEISIWLGFNGVINIQNIFIIIKSPVIAEPFLTGLELKPNDFKQFIPKVKNTIMRKS